MNDPFAPNTNGVPADPWSTPASSETPARQEAPVSVESVNEVSVTFKQHSGFDSPWIVVRGATPTQVKDQLRELYAEELIEAVAQTAQKFAATKPGTSAGVAPRQGASSPPRQNNSTGNGGGGSLPPGVQGKTCRHGEMVFKTGTNKWGKPYEAFFCPTPQDAQDKCKPIFVS